MLINADFERHGFILYDSNSNVSKYKRLESKPGEPIDLIITVTKLRRHGTSKINMWLKGNYTAEEVMWHPDQLRQFLIFHKVIADNKKLL